MHKNRSPNLIIIMIFLYSLVIPVDTSRAITNQTESKEALTVEICKKLLEEMEIETNSLDDPILLEKKKACEILIEQTEPEITNEEEEASTPDMESPEEPNENEVILSPDSEKDEPVVPSTPESDIPTTPEPSTPESDIPMTSEPSTSDNDSETTPELFTPESDIPEVPKVPVTENEAPLLEISDETNDNLAPPEQSNADGEETGVTKNSPEPTASPIKKSPVTSLLGVSVLGNSKLTVSYSTGVRDNNEVVKTIVMENEVTKAVDLPILTKNYVLFKVPAEVASQIEPGSVSLDYIEKGTSYTLSVKPGPAENQFYAELDTSLISLNLLSGSRFKLQFNIKGLPSCVDKIDNFKSAVVNDLVSLDVLGSSSATASLAINPAFHLAVPETLDFGSHELTGRETTIPRLTPMTVAISHTNATGCNWRLQASLPQSMKSTEGHVLDDVLYFKTETTKQPLQKIAIEISTGQMTENPNQTFLTFAEEEGIILDLTGKQATPSTYSADIQWSLINAP